ncbi:MAG: hypothetical protein JKY30_12820 [Flavobacteriales bacterium]|nr:hypothetical protein [Flavobacteriales bacterium]
MKFKNILTKSTLVLLIVVGVSSCSKDEDSPIPESTIPESVDLQSGSYDYMFNTGQVSPGFSYVGSHSNTLSATILLEEQPGGMTKVTVTLKNTISGETYNVHSHDAADATTTPNGTPYNESPNSNVFIQQIMGNGSSASGFQMSTKTLLELTTVYDGFLVVHDPLQNINVVDPTTFVILGIFAR